MKADEVRARMTELGYEFQDEENEGKTVVLRYKTGETVSVYPDGIVFGGKNRAKLARNFYKRRPTKMTDLADNRRVFVVYGKDLIARNQLKMMLHDWKITPLILEELPTKGGETVIEKIISFSNVPYGVVLATPDDEGHERDRADKKKFRARQNVVLEMGLLLGKLGRDRVTVIRQKTQGQEFEPPSDIHGVIYEEFENDLSEISVNLAKRIDAAGIEIEVKHLVQPKAHRAQP